MYAQIEKVNTSRSTTTNAKTKNKRSYKFSLKISNKRLSDAPKKTAQLAQLAFMRTIQEQPKTLIISNNRWWKSPGNITGFSAGAQYTNGTSPDLKKNVEGRNIHATISSISNPVSKADDLKKYVRDNDPMWGTRNVGLVGDRVNLGNWGTEYRKVGGWHISIYNGNNKFGGWYSPTAAALGLFTPTGAYAPTPNDLAAANAIRINMANNIL